MAGARILLVDDDAHIREVVGFALQKEGFEVLVAEDGARALEVFASHGPDLVILDILMPEMDGTEVCRTLRAGSDVPIIFLSSKDDEVDRVVGLELGGDDYVTKPFSPRELIARVRARLRRHAPGRPAEPEPAPAELCVGNLRLCLDSFQAFVDGSPVHLTATEFGLVATLAGRPGRVFTRDELMDGAYDPNHYVSDRTIDSHIRAVRKKLGQAGADLIRTCHGRGYVLG